jgi:NAD(P)-dependent dehydrogenase (short-subunit alcohol dehydrogenase family)
MTTFDFKERVALVTGGSSGIGRAISTQLVQAGATVIMVARDPAKGEAARKEMVERGGRAAFFAVELGDDAAVRRLMQEIDQTYGDLHVVINCAGGDEQKLGVAEHTSVIDRWSRMSGANFLSAYLVTTYGVEIMRRTGGAVINISSTASLHGNYGLYGAMKAGLEGMTRSLALELAPLRIRVNAVAPGWIITPNTLPDPSDAGQAAWEKTASLLGRMGTPDEVAAAVLFLASDLASFITGATLFVDGGLVIIDPTADSWTRMVYKKSAS